LCSGFLRRDAGSRRYFKRGKKRCRLEGEFHQCYAKYDFARAKTLLESLQTKVFAFEREFAQTEVFHPIDIWQLSSLYERAKAQYDESTREAAAQQREIAWRKEEHQQRQGQIDRNRAQEEELKEGIEEQEEQARKAKKVQLKQEQALKQEKGKTAQLEQRIVQQRSAIQKGREELLAKGKELEGEKQREIELLRQKKQAEEARLEEERTREAEKVRLEKEQAKKVAELLALKQPQRAVKAASSSKALVPSLIPRMPKSVEDSKTAFARQPYALSLACQLKNPDVVKDMIRRGSKPDPETLTLAFLSGKPDIINSVVTAGARPSRRTLSAACYTNNIALVQRAIQAGAQPGSKTVAIASKNPAILKLVVDKIMEIARKRSERKKK
jgi:hypothetical protein